MEKSTKKQINIKYKNLTKNDFYANIIYMNRDVLGGILWEQVDIVEKEVQAQVEGKVKQKENLQ